jgi:hypothetical protein
MEFEIQRVARVRAAAHFTVENIYTLAVFVHEHLAASFPENRGARSGGTKHGN